MNRIAAAAGICLAGACGAAFSSSLSSRQIGPHRLQVEVRTDPPVLEAASALPAGFQELRIPGLPLLRDPGRPALPFRTILVGLPAGRRISLAARSLGGERTVAARLAPTLPQNPVGMEADLREAPAYSASELQEMEEASGFGAAGPFPGPLAIVHSTGVLRDQPIAEVRVFPVQYDPQGRLVVHHARIQLEIDFVPEPEGQSPPVTRSDPRPASGPRHLGVFDSILRRALVNYPMVAQERQRHGAASGQADPDEEPGGLTQALAPPQREPAWLGGAGTARISVTQDGLHQVTPAMLESAGFDVAMIDPATFAMRSGGADVPILVDGESDGSFDPQDRVIFHGLSIRGNRYTRTNVYYLTFGGAGGPRMGQRSGAITGPAPVPASFLTTAHAEQNLLYTARVRPGVTEQYYWAVQSRGSASNTVAYSVSTPRVDPAAHTLALRARLLGITSGNHTPRLLLNGTQVAESTFNGQVLFTQSAAPASSGLLPGGNSVTVQLVNNGNPVDQIAADYFEVDYRRTYVVDDDHLLFDAEGTGAVHVQLSNLASGDLLLVDVTAPSAPVRIDVPPGQISAGPPFTLTFEDSLDADRAYAIASRPGLKPPAAVVADVSSSLASPANGADEIIITDRSMLASLQPLAAHRQAQGLRVALVATDDIYDEFAAGLSTPQAIRDFLAYAYASWAAPAPAYVLLAGDGHIDYTDGLGSATPQIIPPLLGIFPSIGEAPSDNLFVAVAGADVFPEMMVGRLPARSAADAAILVANILAYENDPPVAALNARSLFAADNNDPIFQAILENLQAFLPPTMAAAEAYLPGGEPLNPPSAGQIQATTDAIIAGFDDGSLLATYLGHGNVALWALEKILEHNPNPPAGGSARLDAGRLAASGHQSILLGLNCINGYFVDLSAAGPGHVDRSLAEEWLMRPGRGAVASWAPSALGQISDYDSISYELYGAIFDDRLPTVGEAFASALADAVGIYGVDTINIESMHLFGDPATRLALDSDADGLVDWREAEAASDPLDADTDDDGLADGAEALQLGTSPILHDSDADGLFDGTETGVTTPGPGTQTGAGHFAADADPLTTTDPLDPDSDGGGVSDGEEDADHDGAVDPGETDPNLAGDDLACPGPLPEVTGLVVSRSGDDVVLSWDPATAVPCAGYRVYAAAGVGLPKSSFAPFAALGETAAAGFIHVGGALQGVDHDYLVRVVHPQLGEGPLGAYGQ